MAARSTWKGAIRLSLITIPVRVFAATKSSDVSFRQLHRKCHTPIQLRKWCPQCEQEVDAGDIVKGYESSRGEYAIVEQEEIEKLRPESTHVIDVAHIVEASAVDPIYIERAYYLAPDGKTAGASFAVLREGLGTRAGIGRVAMHGREYLVAVQPKDDAIVMYTLRTAGEVRDVSEIEQLEFASGRVKPEEVKLARQVLEHFDSRPDLKSFTDNYQQALREMLETKAPEAAARAETGAKPKKVVDLMSALRDSLAEVKAKDRKAKAPLRQSRPAVKRRRAS